MPRAGQVCSAPGCPRLRPCPAHGREAVRFHHRVTSKRTYGPEHRALRSVVFARDGYRCVECGSTARLQLGHRDRLGPDTEANTFTQCRRCNLRQAQREASESRGAR